MTSISVHCPHCQSDQIVKRGKTSCGTQRYLCQNRACIPQSFLLDYRYRGYVPEVKRRLAEVERLYVDRMIKTRDANEGLNAFIAKRPPKWEHR